jgi:hypothetical protein
MRYADIFVYLLKLMCDLMLFGFKSFKSVKQILSTSVSGRIVFIQHEHNVLIFPKNFETVFIANT